MFIKKHYQVRHKILQTLFDYDNSFDIAVPTNQKLLHFNEICKKLNQFDKIFLLDNLNYLQTTKEIYCTMQFDNSSFAIIGLGRDSFIERKFLTEGRKEFRNSFDQKLKIISTIILLLIAITTFVINIIQTQNNKKEIENLKLQLEKVELKTNSK